MPEESSVPYAFFCGNLASRVRYGAALLERCSSGWRTPRAGRKPDCSGISLRRFSGLVFGPFKLCIFWGLRNFLQRFL
jgi:hypothetical protein